MIGDKTDLANARARADAARTRLAGTLGRIQARLHPRALMKEAWEEVREQGGELAAKAMRDVQEKPGRTAAIAGAVALFLAREPIARGVKHLLGGADDDAEHDAEDDNATGEADTGSAKD